MKKIILFVIFILTAFNTIAPSPITTLRIDDIIKEYITTKNPNVKSWVIDGIVRNTTKVAEEFSLKPLMLIAIMNVESAFKHKAKSYKGGKPLAYGLMQVRADLWVDKNHSKNLIKNDILNSRTDLYNIYYNIRAGGFILTEKIRICEIWKNRGEFTKRGYETSTECFLSRYNGALKNDKRYFNKVITSLQELQDIKSNKI